MLLFVLTWGKGFVGGRLTGKESEARWNRLEHAEEVLGSPRGQGRGPGAGLLPGEAAGAGAEQCQAQGSRTPHRLRARARGLRMHRVPCTWSGSVLWA